MTLANKRIQDPILTQLAQGYHNAELVGDFLMPVVEIEKEGGMIPKFGRLAFRNQSTLRQLHGDSNRLTPEDITALTVQLAEHDIEYPIDYRENNEASYPLRSYALGVVQDIIALGREIEIAQLAQDENNYSETNKITLTGNDKFTAKGANPLKIIDTAMDKVTATIGKKPNTCVISDDVWQVLKNNDVLLDRIKYTRAGILTPQIFAELIGVDVVKIGAAMREVDGNLVKIWSDCLILAYVSPKSKTKNGNIYDPSYGYTIRRQNGLFVDTYQEKGGKVEIVRCTDIHKPYLVGNSAGFLIKGCK